MYSLFEVLPGSVLLILSILYFLFENKTKKCLKNVPGPKPLPLFGNMLDFTGPTSDFLPNSMKYFKQYGPIVKLHTGPLDMAVIVADRNFMEYILSSTKLIDKAPQYRFLHNWLGNGLLTSTGMKWKKHRKMITPSFHFSVLENFLDTFDSKGNIFIKKLEDFTEESSFDIYPLVTKYTLDVIYEAAMGISVNAQEDGGSEYVQSVKIMCKIIVDRSFSPLQHMLYPLTMNYYREKKALRIIHAHANEIIDRRIKEKKDSLENNADKGLRRGNRKPAFLDLLLKSTIDGKPLRKTDIREEVDTFMFEGHDTTSSAISFTLYLLANKADVQLKVLEEQQRLLSKNDKPTITDLQDMKYLEMVIKETLRLYPSVPFYGRTVSEDFEWEGTVYPKNLCIMVVPFASHRNPKYFLDPEVFIPERFDENSESYSYIYLPFSAGPRNCIGQKFAMLEMKSIISKVVRNFELLPSTPPHQLILAPESILISKNGIRLSLRKRQY